MSGYGGGYVDALTVPQLLGWDVSATETLGATCLAKSVEFEEEATASIAATDSSYEYWEGDAGDAAREKATEDKSDAIKSVDVLESLGKTIQNHASEMRSLLDKLRGKVSEVEESDYELFVADDGAVNSRVSNREWLERWGKAVGPLKLLRKESDESDLESDIREVMAQILEVDKRGAEQVARCLEELSDTVKTGVTAIPTDPALAEILRKYQAPKSDEGTELWPSGALLKTIQLAMPDFQPSLMTPEEIAMMQKLIAKNPLDYPVELYKLNSIKDEAEEAAKAQFPMSMDDGHGDAFRHTYWNARMTQEFGPEWTEEFATAHEGTGANSPHREAMDLYNNELGRKIAQQYPDASPEELARHVNEAIESGDAIVIGSDQQIHRSNTVIEQSTVSPNPIDIPLPAQ